MKPTRATLHQVIKRAQERVTHTNFMNEMHAMERRRNNRLQLTQVNSLLYDKLTPGMRENLGHRRKELEKQLKGHWQTSVFDS